MALKTIRNFSISENLEKMSHNREALFVFCTLLLTIIPRGKCVGKGCVSYTVNHIYGPDGPSTHNNTGTGIEMRGPKGDTGSPGKMGPTGPPGPPGTGSKVCHI